MTSPAAPWFWPTPQAGLLHGTYAPRSCTYPEVPLVRVPVMLGTKLWLTFAAIALYMKEVRTPVVSRVLQVTSYVMAAVYTWLIMVLIVRHPMLERPQQAVSTGLYVVVGVVGVAFCVLAGLFFGAEANPRGPEAELTWLQSSWLLLSLRVAVVVLAGLDMFVWLVFAMYSSMEKYHVAAPSTDTETNSQEFYVQVFPVDDNEFTQMPSISSVVVSM